MQDRARRSDLTASPPTTGVRLATLAGLPRRLLRAVSARRVVGVSSAAELLDACLDFVELIGSRRTASDLGARREVPVASRSRPVEETSRGAVALSSTPLLLPLSARGTDYFSGALIRRSLEQHEEAWAEIESTLDVVDSSPEITTVEAELDEVGDVRGEEAPPSSEATNVVSSEARETFEDLVERITHAADEDGSSIFGSSLELEGQPAPVSDVGVDSLIEDLISDWLEARAFEAAAARFVLQPVVELETEQSKEPEVGEARPDYASGGSPAEIEETLDDLIAGWIAAAAVESAMAAARLEAAPTVELEAAPSTELEGPPEPPRALEAAELEGPPEPPRALEAVPTVELEVAPCAELEGPPEPSRALEAAPIAELEGPPEPPRALEPVPTVEFEAAPTVELEAAELEGPPEPPRELEAASTVEMPIAELEGPPEPPRALEAAPIAELEGPPEPPHALEAAPVAELEGPPEPPRALDAAPIAELEGPPEPSRALAAANVELAPPAAPPSPLEDRASEPVTTTRASIVARRPQARVRPTAAKTRRPWPSCPTKIQRAVPAASAPTFKRAPDPRLTIPSAPPVDTSTAWQRRPDRTRSPGALLCATPGGPLRPPAALAYLATYARTQGLALEVLDLNLDLARRLGPAWAALWQDQSQRPWIDPARFALLLELISPHLDGYAELLANHPAPLLAFTVSGSRQNSTLELIRRVLARAPGKRVLLGGPACLTPEGRRSLLESSSVALEGFALGEGEQLLCDAMAAAEAGEDLRQVPGVLAWHDGRELPYRRRKRLLPLDRVPFPRYEDFDLRRYPGDGELTMEWSRGCVGACTFCQDKAIDGRYRGHSALAIVSALRRCAHDLGVHRFQICDPLLNGDPLVLGEVCRRILAERLDVEWRGQAAPTRALTPELLRNMRRAGCTELRFGLESAADPVLYRMNKRRLFSSVDAGDVIRACHAAGIRTSVSFMVGFPGEGEREFQRSCDFLRDHAAQIDEVASVTPLHVLPDTPLALQAMGYGIRMAGRGGAGEWVAEGNTPEQRRDRAQRMIALAHDLGLAVGPSYLSTSEVDGDGAPRVGWSGACRSPGLLSSLLGDADPAPEALEQPSLPSA